MTEELCHVRCIECGKVLSNKWNRYQELLGEGVKIADALTMLGLTRYCCRMRMMNPFKIPIRGDRQIDPRDTGIDARMETLTIATGDPSPGLAPLQAMGQNIIPQNIPGQNIIPQNIIPQNTTNQPGYTIVPLAPTEGGIALPAIPQVALPAIPIPGAKIAPEEPTNVIRTYQAW